MQVKSEINDMFHYSIVPVFCLIFLLLFLVIIYVIIKNYSRTNNNYIPKSIKDIKRKYLYELYSILRDYNSNSNSLRNSYHKLSVSIRNFVYEVTGISVQNYTLKEIKSLDIPVIYDLISECYDAQFKLQSRGNFIKCINKARLVIKKWK